MRRAISQHELSRCASLIDKNGGDSKSVRWLEISDPQHVAAMKSGRSSASVGEPALDDAFARGTVRVLGPVFDAIALRFMIAGYCTSEAFAKANPEVIARFADAINEAAHWANQPKNYAQSAQIIGPICNGAGTSR